MLAPCTVPDTVIAGPWEPLLFLKDSFQPLQGDPRTRPSGHGALDHTDCLCLPLPAGGALGLGKDEARRSRLLPILQGHTIHVLSGSLCGEEEMTEGFFMSILENQQGQEGRDPTESTFLPARDHRLFCHQFCPLLQSMELAESWMTAGPAPGLCSGFFRNLQLTPNSQLSNSCDSFACGLKEDGAVTHVAEMYWVLNQHCYKTVLE